MSSCPKYIKRPFWNSHASRVPPKNCFFSLVFKKMLSFQQTVKLDNPTEIHKSKAQKDVEV